MGSIGALMASPDAAVPLKRKSETLQPSVLLAIVAIHHSRDMSVTVTALDRAVLVVDRARSS